MSDGSGSTRIRAFMLPRPRPATAQDGPACIPLIQAAGGDLLRWSLAPGGIEVVPELLTRCWSMRGHPLGPHNTTVVEVGGTVAAALVGDSVQGWTQSEQAHPVALARLAPRSTLLAIQRRLNAQRQVRPPLPTDAWYLSSLGVDPDFRRRGLGRMLLAEATTKARALGLNRIVMEVVANNHAAVQLYRAAGYVEVTRWTPRSGPEMLRMINEARA